ncbi:hypothetical protein BD289DRAFT_264284 [Coniella lustricola]|uniref:Uncharacterized protein n=1 Tax=Coniella lustricola TaxID=2025994 RepID=A0A2T3A7E3_9PEZI|nr:hypothetical protein BD289DRAFT_264284 [Coniella lustricola]
MVRRREKGQETNKSNQHRQRDQEQRARYYKVTFNHHSHHGSKQTKKNRSGKSKPKATPNLSSAVSKQFPFLGPSSTGVRRKKSHKDFWPARRSLTCSSGICHYFFFSGHVIISFNGDIKVYATRILRPAICAVFRLLARVFLATVQLRFFEASTISIKKKISLLVAATGAKGAPQSKHSAENQ